MENKNSATVEVPVGDFKDTLNLPRTDFPLRADAKVNDPLMLKRWEEQGLYEKAMHCNKGAMRYILHDGPPYANGHIHLGHAYNKLVKDMITKAHRMMGYHVPVVPGWDCHGLPIEHKVTQEHPGLAGAALKKECRAYAAHWVATQKDEFKRLGVVMDWEHPYITMDPGYEACIVRAFGAFVKGGFIARKNKTIPWCSNCQTALASAEIEYQERKDPSLYLLFRVVPEEQKAVFPTLEKPVFLAVWTTTPWTIPLNRAVILKEGGAYELLEVDEKIVVVGSSLAGSLAQKLAEKGKTVTRGETFSATRFEGMHVQHPLNSELHVPLIFDQSVALDEGTACVHCAPGCGPIDYEIAVKRGLEIYSPLSADGRYTAGILPVELEGKTIIEGQEWVMKALAATGALLLGGSIRHSYPHCWRCHQGLMFRATPQWFCDLSHGKVKERALAALDEISFLPAQGKNFLKATIESRWEWCLSRQRSWGVPIVALVSRQGEVYLEPAFIEAIAAKIESDGIEYWDTVTLAQLRDEGLLPKNFPLEEWRKETDILDVWFDSGVSHYAVLAQRPELQVPADLYVEGLDQHRGWFQSSLLTGIVVEGRAPMKAIMTHGFTVDEQGRKMSKSLGNVVDPLQVVEQLGTDGLRVWAASIGIEGDAVFSERLLQNVGQVLRKVRNTCRFLLQNLFDYDHEQEALPFAQLQPLDRYMLYQLCMVHKKALEEYRKGNLVAVVNLINTFCAVEISSFYGDIVKDRLYCEKADSVVRRSVQMTFWYILDTLTKLMAPIFSFTAEAVSDHYQNPKSTSIHLQRFADLSMLELAVTPVDKAAYEAQWAFLRSLRSAVLKGIEEVRAQGVVGHSLDAAVTLSFDKEERFALMNREELAAFLPFFCIVSQITFQEGCDGLVVTEVAGVAVRVAHAAGSKCPRCWQWDVVFDKQGLCRRCHQVLA